MRKGPSGDSARSPRVACRSEVVGLHAVSRLQELGADPAKADALGTQARQLFEEGITSALKGLQALLTAAVADALVAGDERRQDRLIKAEQVAERRAMKVGWVYHRKLPFRVKPGTVPRFSERGLEEYIRKRLGT